MPYPSMILESLRKLEASRQQRLEQDIPLLTLDEKTELLESFHPDYRSGSKEEIPFLVLTANATTEALKMCKEAGADAFFSRMM